MIPYKKHSLEKAAHVVIEGIHDPIVQQSPLSYRVVSSFSDENTEIQGEELQMVLKVEPKASSNHHHHNDPFKIQDFSTKEQEPHSAVPWYSSKLCRTGFEIIIYFVLYAKVHTRVRVKSAVVKTGSEQRLAHLRNNVTKFSVMDIEQIVAELELQDEAKKLQDHLANLRKSNEDALSCMVASVDEWLRTFGRAFVSETNIDKPSEKRIEKQRKPKSKKSIEKGEKPVNKTTDKTPTEPPPVTTSENNSDTIANTIPETKEETKTIWQRLLQTIENMEEKSTLEPPRQEILERPNYQYNSIKLLIDTKEHGKLFSTEHLFSQSIFQKSCTNVTSFSKALLKRILHKSVYVKQNNTIYIWGGLTDNGVTNELITLDLDKMNLSPKRQESKISERIFHTFDFVVHSNVFVVIGGIDKRGNILSDINIAGTNFAWKDYNGFIPKLCGHATASTFHEIYIFGGFNGDLQQYSNDFYCFDLFSKEIRLVMSKCPIEPRAGSSMAVIENNIYIFGGHSNSRIFSDLYRFNITSKTLFKVSSIDSWVVIPRLTMSSLYSNGGALLLFGGWNGSEWNTTLFEADSKNLRWQIATRNFDSIFDTFTPFCSATSIAGKLMLLGGIPNQIPFVSFQDTLLRFVCCKEPLEARDNSALIAPSFRTLHQKRTKDDLDLCRFYLEWYNTGAPEECDVTILINQLDENAEQEKFYGHKLMLARSSVLKKKIFALDMFEQHETERAQDIMNDFLNSSEASLKHGHPVAILLDDLPIQNITNLRTSFKCIMQYLYSGMFETKYLTTSDFEDIYILACYLELPLLKKALCADVFTFSDMNSHCLLVYLAQTMKTFLTLEDEVIENINDYVQHKIDQNPVPIGMVRLVAPTSLDLDVASYRSVLVHKWILTKRSKYFHSVFEMNFLESKTRVMIFEQNTIRSVLTILNYIYTLYLSSVDMDQSNAVEIYMSSFQFELGELHEYSKNVIREQQNVDIPTMIQLLEICDVVDDKLMKGFCKFNIAKHYDEIMKTDPSMLDKFDRDVRLDIQKQYCNFIKKK
ncbi:hypothetical protein C9374_001030 [Naegleria lovaniensis]|uniref:BTB domain-containing protein n=1 Tax=Naegleria lovaniensis TaxID=51637 RepID=A0AA88KLR7_NAELO|nr:uncharacterized protein C9374_001030 [Naegleria lovaniensis]KAG2388180.1 hypothetical protein C9374_001030 [Naegleria lovaniensis]